MRSVLCAAIAVAVCASAHAQNLDEALKPVATYMFGDSREPLTVVNDLVRKADNSGDKAQRKAAEASLLAVLQANPTPDAVDFLCRQLAIIGSEASVPVLAPMLTRDEQSADWARYALEGIASKEVDDALLDAVTKTSGRARVGIINSLGVRKTEAAVPVLVTFSNDSDPAVASAAIAALGLIGGDEAAAAVAKARGGPLKHVAEDAYIACANAFLAEGKKNKAVEIYHQLQAESEPVRVRAAAVLGLAKAEPAKSQSVLVDLLKGDDEYLRAVAVGELRHIDNEEVTRAVAAALPGLNAEAQVLALGVLEAHGNKAALPAVVDAARSSEPDVQVAAVRAMGVLGDAGTVPQLLTAATSENPEVKRAANDALDTLHGEDVDPMLLGAMAGADTETRGILVRTLAARGAKSALPALFAAADDSEAEIRSKAFDALGVLAGPEDLPRLVELHAKKIGDSSQQAAESALVAVSQKLPEAGARATAVLNAIDNAQDEKTRASLVSVAGRIAEPAALPKLRELAAQSDQAAVQDAAVRALAEWPSTATLDDLRKMAAESKNDTHRQQAYNGMIRIARMDGGPDLETQLKVYEEALTLAKTPDDKRLVLAGLGRVADARALELAKTLENDEAVKDEAKQAIEQITKALAPKEE